TKIGEGRSFSEEHHPANSFRGLSRTLPRGLAKRRANCAPQRTCLPARRSAGWHEFSARESVHMGDSRKLGRLPTLAKPPRSSGNGLGTTRTRRRLANFT